MRGIPFFSKAGATLFILILGLSGPPMLRGDMWLNNNGYWTNALSWQSGSVPSNVPAYVTYPVTVILDGPVPRITALNLWDNVRLVLTNNAHLSVSGIVLSHLNSSGTIVHASGTLDAYGEFSMGPNVTNASAHYYMQDGVLNIHTGRIHIGQFELNNSSRAHLFRQTGGTVRFLPTATSLELSYFAEYRLENGLLDLGGRSMLIRRTTSLFTFTGGVVQGVGAFEYGRDFVQNGGVFRVGSSPSTFSTTLVASAAGQVNSFTCTAGRVEFDVFGGTGSNDCFNLLSSSAQLDLSGGTVFVNFTNYTPKVGDSWDFIKNTANGTVTLSAANVGSSSLPGLIFDTSQWVSQGILTVQKLPPLKGSLLIVR